LPAGTIDPIHKVSIIPRGQALGVTHLLPEQDRLSIDKEHALGNIAMLMGGRIAEELAFDGRMTTGAGDDIRRASEIARRMVCEWGMSERLGPITFGQNAHEPFLGRDLARQQNYSESTAQAIDAEVHRLISEQYRRARGLLEANKGALERVARALFEREALTADEVHELVAGRALPPLQHPAREDRREKRAAEDKDPRARPAPFPVAGTVISSSMNS
jgi:cell division protease FtsH